MSNNTVFPPLLSLPQRSSMCAINLFGVLCVITLYLSPESVPWLIKNGRHEEAFEILKSVAESRKIPFDQEEYDRIVAEEKEEEGEEEDEGGEEEEGNDDEEGEGKPEKRRLGEEGETKGITKNFLKEKCVDENGNNLSLKDGLTTEVAIISSTSFSSSPSPTRRCWQTASSSAPEKTASAPDIDSDFFSAIHNYLHVGDSENLGLKHNFGQYLEMRCSGV